MGERERESKRGNKEEEEERTDDGDRGSSPSTKSLGGDGEGGGKGKSFFSLFPSSARGILMDSFFFFRPSQHSARLGATEGGRGGGGGFSKRKEQPYRGGKIQQKTLFSPYLESRIALTLSRDLGGGGET